MEQKNLKISLELHEKLVTESKKRNIKIGEFAQLSIGHFIDGKADPRNPPQLKEIRDTFITFIRTQEKSYLIPMKDFDMRMVQELDALNHNTSVIKASVTVLQKDVDDLHKKMDKILKILEQNITKL